ncbi:Elongator complex protein 4 [Crassisporium funariophilum]|nr:Elongator complex protein 4 [Crassisporium funariophilum]
MSSFKRNSTTGKQTVAAYPGTRISPVSKISIITSTGISSLDDILGGGLPLSCSLLIAAPDIHTSYGELIQKYFTAQGLASGHRVCVIGQDAELFVRDIMWFPKTSGQKAAAGDSDDDEKVDQSHKVKIAWRYENMKRFKTTVGATSQDMETFCHAFELSSRVPDGLVDDALSASQLRLMNVGSEDPSLVKLLHEISEYLTADTSIPVRICIPSLGSPSWGDVTTQSILHFLHSLRSTLRRHPHGCASITLPPHLSSDTWGGPGWIQKLGWASDAALTLAAFSGNPALSSIFPSHHGLVQIHTLPSPHTLSPPSDRFSTLRGLASSSSSSGGGGENNIAFKCTRKRLLFETMHLDIEGGTGERRTTPSGHEVEHHTVAVVARQDQGGKAAQVEVELEGVSNKRDVKKARKVVAFQSDRPELYDF